MCYAVKGNNPCLLGESYEIYKLQNEELLIVEAVVHIVTT
jgi:hypothetical protein